MVTLIHIMFYEVHNQLLHQDLSFISLPECTYYCISVLSSLLVHVKNKSGQCCCNLHPEFLTEFSPILYPELEREWNQLYRNLMLLGLQNSHFELVIVFKFTSRGSSGLSSIRRYLHSVSENCQPTLCKTISWLIENLSLTAVLWHFNARPPTNSHFLLALLFHLR